MKDQSTGWLKLCFRGPAKSSPENRSCSNPSRAGFSFFHLRHGYVWKCLMRAMKKVQVVTSMSKHCVKKSNRTKNSAVKRPSLPELWSVRSTFRRGRDPWSGGRRRPRSFRRTSHIRSSGKGRGWTEGGLELETTKYFRLRYDHWAHITISEDFIEVLSSGSHR